MKYRYTTDDYLSAIRREKAKRSTTYPKIIAKKIKRGEDTTKLNIEMSSSIELLLAIEYMIQGFGLDIYSDVTKTDAIIELIREYKMRVKTYPRWIWLDRNRKSPRMTQEVADYELAVWREMCIYYAETMLGDYQIALNAIDVKRRTKKNSDQ